jgi:hypothetical protein
MFNVCGEKKTYYQMEKGGEKLTAVAGRRTVEDVRRPTNLSSCPLLSIQFPDGDAAV